MAGTPANPNVLFICSAGHSGSTLLDLTLGSHSLVESLGEITHLPKNLALNTECCCGAAVRDCHYWQAVLGETDKRLGTNSIQNPYSLNLGFINATDVVDYSHQTALRQLHRRMEFGLQYYRLKHNLPIPKAAVATIEQGVANKNVLYEAVAEHSQVNTIVDSSKHYLEAVTQYRLYPENTRIVLLVRDGRAVFYSGLKRGYARNKALGAWRNTYKRALPVLQKHIPDNRILTVHYEHLAQDPKQVLEDICAFSDIEFEADMLNFQDRESHITNGNNMRFSDSSEIKLDTGWSKNLPVEELRYFNKYANALNSKLGYE